MLRKSLDDRSSPVNLEGIFPTVQQDSNAFDPSKIPAHIFTDLTNALDNTIASEAECW